MNQYKYGIENYTGDSFGDAEIISCRHAYDLNDYFDREMLAEEIAQEYWSQGGYEMRGWANNEYPIKVYLWSNDGNKKYEYDVWVEMRPDFRAVSKT